MTARDTDFLTTRFFNPEEEQRFRDRWTFIQASFLDEPRAAVTRADELVTDIADCVAAAFARERAALESQWDADEQTSTEALRIALRQYRGYMERLLALDSTTGDAASPPAGR